MIFRYLLRRSLIRTSAKSVDRQFIEDFCDHSSEVESLKHLLKGTRFRQYVTPDDVTKVMQQMEKEEETNL